MIPEPFHTYEHCPRCNGNWKRQGAFDRCACGMSCVYGYGDLNIRFGDCVLYWDGLNPTNGCLYVYSRVSAALTFELPWLPFTITKEDLDKYLLLA